MKSDITKTILISTIISGAMGYYFVYLDNSKIMEIANLKGQIVQLKAKVDSCR